MPLIEVEEGDIQRLKNELASAKASHTVLERLGKNPKTRMKTLALMKEDNPSLVIPEIDAAQPVLEELGKTKEEIAALKKQLKEKEEEEAKAKRDAEVDGRIDTGRALLKRLGYNDDGIKGVEDLMQKRGIADYEAAEALFERENKQPESIIPGNYGRDSSLFDPPEGNPWVEALKPRGSRAAQDKAIRSVTNKEVNKWFAENRPTHRARA